MEVIWNWQLSAAFPLAFPQWPLQRISHSFYEMYFTCFINNFSFFHSGCGRAESRTWTLQLSISISSHAVKWILKLDSEVETAYFLLMQNYATASPARISIWLPELLLNHWIWKSVPFYLLVNSCPTFHYFLKFIIWTYYFRSISGFVFSFTKGRVFARQTC